MRSYCCGATVLFQHPITHLYVAAQPTDPAYIRTVQLGREPRCGQCNREAFRGR